MDRSLDEIISERPPPRPRGAPRSELRARAPPPPRAPRREEYPRDGVRKYHRDEPVNMNEYVERRHSRGGRAAYSRDSNRDWVHDRYEEDRRERFDRDAYDGRGARDDRPARGARPDEASTKVRVENLHYDVTQRDLQELFERIGPVAEARLVYDRMDRSTGTAYVTYKYPRDAQDAVADFDGQSARGQIIRLSLLPAGPSGPAKGGSLFDRIEQPTRSLADRVSGAPLAAKDSREDLGGRRRRPRSESPRRRTAVPERIDRYMPGGRDSRSPIGRRGTPRGGGRRPGQRREDGERPPPKGPREGGGERRGKPKKTAEELDAEMADYFGGGGGGDAGATQQSNGGSNAAATDDIDMVE